MGSTDVARAWHALARAAPWSSTDPRAKVLNRERVRFELAEGNYRLAAAFDFCRLREARRHAHGVWPHQCDDGIWFVPTGSSRQRELHFLRRVSAVERCSTAWCLPGQEPEAFAAPRPAEGTGARRLRCIARVIRTPPWSSGSLAERWRQSGGVGRHHPANENIQTRYFNGTILEPRDRHEQAYRSGSC
jgi:hypothetical protein